MITIDGQELKTSRPSDLDAQLVASTGCNAAEIDTLLAAGTDRAAAALRPFLDAGVLPGAELGRAIAADRAAVPAIRALYAPGVGAASDVPAKTKTKTEAK